MGGSGSRGWLSTRPRVKAGLSNARLVSFMITWLVSLVRFVLWNGFIRSRDRTDQLISEKAGDPCKPPALKVITVTGSGPCSPPELVPSFSPSPLSQRQD